MDVLKASAVASLALLAACASTQEHTGPAVTHVATAQADGSIAITVTARSEPLTASDGSVSLKLTDYLEAAAAEECGGREFELTQGGIVPPVVEDGRMVGTLDGVARCK